MNGGARPKTKPNPSEDQALKEFRNRPQAHKQYSVYFHTLLDERDGWIPLPTSAWHNYHRTKTISSTAAYSCEGVISGFHQFTLSLYTLPPATGAPPQVQILVNYAGYRFQFKCLSHSTASFGACQCFKHLPLSSFSATIPGINRPFFFNWAVQRNHLVLQIDFYFELDDYRLNPEHPRMFVQPLHAPGEPRGLDLSKTPSRGLWYRPGTDRAFSCLRIVT